LKKHFLIIFVLLVSINHGYAQSLSLFSRPKDIHVTNLTVADSISRCSNLNYFPVVADDENYTLSVDQSKIEFLYGVPYTSAKYNYLKVPVMLINTSATTLRYFSMSGSWWDIYETDNQNLKVFAQSSCYKNSRIILSVPPNQYIEKDIIIEVPKEESKAIAFKVGMVLQRELENVHSINAKPTQLSFLIPARQSLIWSNYVMVSRWSSGKKKEKYNSGF
jgi:hypothetical protein